MKAIFKTAGKVVGGLCILGLTACSLKDIDQLNGDSGKAAKTEQETIEAKQLLWGFEENATSTTHKKKIGYAPGDSATVEVTLIEVGSGFSSNETTGFLVVRDGKTGHPIRSENITVAKPAKGKGL